ncbi:MAG: hypothetical protein IJK71_13560 [Clostridia bacterium]|jgi:hypothetical protein|nr:hypothetical protein [Clostridia bacterium]
MKKTWAGGFLALLGTIWSVAIICIAGNNLPDSWYTNLGKFWSNVVDLKLMPLFVITTLITVLGLVLVLIDLFRKEK